MLPLSVLVHFVSNLRLFQADPARGPGRRLHRSEEPRHQGRAEGAQGARVLRARQAPAQGEISILWHILPLGKLLNVDQVQNLGIVSRPRLVIISFLMVVVLCHPTIDEESRLASPKVSCCQRLPVLTPSSFLLTRPRCRSL